MRITKDSLCIKALGIFKTLSLLKNKRERSALKKNTELSPDAKEYFMHLIELRDIILLTDPNLYKIMVLSDKS